MIKDTILTTNTDYDKSFLALVNHIKSLYPEGKLSKVEAHQAARNLIEFVKIMLKYAEKK
jgi:hypothetical protein